MNPEDFPAPREGFVITHFLVVSDQVGSPTYTRHLAGALAEMVEGEAYGIHHVAAGGS